MKINLRCSISTPTRELALQVNEDITNIGRFKRIKSMAVYGKAPFHIQKAELKQRTHMVVGTPDACMIISSGARWL